VWLKNNTLTNFIVEKKNFNACKLVKEVVLSLKKIRKNNINQICCCRVERRKESGEIKLVQD
jgi:hypothetical protein